MLYRTVNINEDSLFKFLKNGRLRVVWLYHELPPFGPLSRQIKV